GKLGVLVHCRKVDARTSEKPSAIPPAIVDKPSATRARRGIAWRAAEAGAAPATDGAPRSSPMVTIASATFTAAAAKAVPRTPSAGKSVNEVRSAPRIAPAVLAA